MEILMVLKDISEINFSGNIIPHNWYKHVTYSTAGGKTKADLLAINILADVVYWHRLTEIRDEATGKIIKYDKKFHGDKLQKSYDSYADQFGSTKRAVKDSVDLLVNLKLIQRDFEDFKPFFARSKKNPRLITKKMASISTPVRIPLVRLFISPNRNKPLTVASFSMTS
jgi:hypothetical protein